MKRTALARIAVISAFAAIAVGALHGARRPRYGGELRVETRASFENPEALNTGPFAGAIFETLVRLDDHGDPQPWLATSWSHDSARKRWVFTPRASVILHNGAPWSPGPIEYPDDQPIENLLRDLARPRNHVVVHLADGSVAGTGPFRVTQRQGGKTATLAAHDQYWGGRPYLDSIQLSMARPLREQKLDFDVSKADVIEISPAERRRVGEYFSQPNETLALTFDDRVPAAACEAVALSVDRAAIYNVLLQKSGEISGALLPSWLSGYAFLFPAARDLPRAQQLARNATLSFSYDRQDALLRAIGDRISVNATEAGITLRPATGPAEVRLQILPVTSRDARTSLEDLASLLKMPLRDGTSYEAERALLADFRVVPLFHLPDAWAVNARVHNWPRLADVWLDAGAKP